jgi:hypothetical protein
MSCAIPAHASMVLPAAGIETGFLQWIANYASSSALYDLFGYISDGTTSIDFSEYNWYVDIDGTPTQLMPLYTWQTNALDQVYNPDTGMTYEEYLYGKYQQSLIPSNQNASGVYLSLEKIDAEGNYWYLYHGIQAYSMPSVLGFADNSTDSNIAFNADNLGATYEISWSCPFADILAPISGYYKIGYYCYEGSYTTGTNIASGSFCFGTYSSYSGTNDVNFVFNSSAFTTSYPNKKVLAWVLSIKKCN